MHKSVSEQFSDLQNENVRLKKINNETLDWIKNYVVAAWPYHDRIKIRTRVEVIRKQIQ